MKTRLRIPKKTPTPAINQTPSTQLVQTRPFPVNLNLHDDQSKLTSTQEHITPLAFNSEQISVNAPGSEPLAPIQAKMTIGAPGDQYEQEADQMAAQVVSQINQPATVQRQNPEEEEINMKPESIQRQNPEEEEINMKPESIQRQNPEEEEINMKPESIQRQNPEEEEINMKPASIQKDAQGGMSASPNIETAIQSQKGQGSSLEPKVQEKMENAFNADFSSVKIHHNQESDQLNQSIQARAFTTGQDLFFRQGAYQPNSPNGQELLAHELTHVVQQNGSAVQKKKD